MTIDTFGDLYRLTKALPTKQELDQIIEALNEYDDLLRAGFRSKTCIPGDGMQNTLRRLRDAL